jgi:hypothetical protein
LEGGGAEKCEILPYTKDSWVSTAFENYLAMIYVACGEKDVALKQLDRSAKLPVGITYGELNCNPEWDPLRGDPRFEKIVTSRAPKDATSTK